MTEKRWCVACDRTVWSDHECVPAQQVVTPTPLPRPQSVISQANILAALTAAGGAADEGWLIDHLKLGKADQRVLRRLRYELECMREAGWILRDHDAPEGIEMIPRWRLTHWSGGVR